MNAAHEARCFYCATPLPSAVPAPAGARLLLPWGEALLVAGWCLIIGRGEPPLADRLIGYPNVSRRHAVLTCDDGVTVVDEHSTNGTTVNGRRIEPGRTIRLRDGDELGFGADLRAQVRFP